MGLRTRLKAAFSRDRIDTTSFVLAVVVLVAGTQGTIEVSEWFAGFVVVSIVGFFGRKFREE